MSMSSSLPFKLALLFSVSLAGAATLTTNFAGNYPFHFHRKLGTNSSYSIFPSTKPRLPKATVSDLLFLLGSPQQAESVNTLVATELRSCFKFLVQFPFDQTRRSLASKPSLPSNHRGKDVDALILSPPEPVLELARLPSNHGGKDVDALILSPPEPVLELARLAVDSGADPGVIQRALDPTIIPVPDVEGSNEYRCELTRTPYGWRFVDEVLNSYMEFLFEVIVERGPSVGLNVSLSRYDLFHGHLFLSKESGRLGILFHAREYPAFDKEVFPYNMGYCQVGSNVAYNDSMNLRNILWLAPLPSSSTKAWLAPGVLVVLDAYPEGIIYKDLIPEYVNYARTLYEEDFGEVVFDVNYLNIGNEVPKFQIFIC